MHINEYDSMGFVETASLVAAIEAADAMVKAAHVRLASSQKPGGGRVCVFAHGDLASCMAAVAAGKAAAERLGAFLQSHVLARPDTCSHDLWNEHMPAMCERKKLRDAERRKEAETPSNNTGNTEEAADRAVSHGVEDKAESPAVTPGGKAKRTKLTGKKD